MATDVKTDLQFFEEILALIDGTHWVKSALACPVWKTEEYHDAANRLRHRLILEDGKPVIVKTTYCLVGLVMKVADIEPHLSGDLPPGMTTMNRLYPIVRDMIKITGGADEDNLKENEQGQRIIRKLCSNLPNRVPYWKDQYGDPIPFEDAVALLENWNDNRGTSKEAVRNLVVTCIDAEKNEETSEPNPSTLT